MIFNNWIDPLIENYLKGLEIIEILLSHAILVLSTFFENSSDISLLPFVCKNIDIKCEIENLRKWLLERHWTI